MLYYCFLLLLTTISKPTMIKVTGINLGPSPNINPTDTPAKIKNPNPKSIPPGIKGHFPVLCLPKIYIDKKAAPKLPKKTVGIIIPRVNPLTTKKINIPNHIKIDPGIKKPMLFLE